ncbi:hypothetical protein IGI04_039072 [Brassica rapa subsp. trilocularis]|uniref:Uncharacterized protein n=1 Tax=Brassica rapa subsp. trilocularis TaxID=1813537 RepID=A0ABQ7LM39_BRACM|nr:hypothetical protein IGI04_039072 [Brassica rapa subsp. trilocularis]
MARGVAVKSSAKKKGVAFVIDCSKPVDDEIMEIATLEKFLQERIKVGGKPGALGDSVSITKNKGKITVTADPTSPNDRNVYELRYFNIEDDAAGDE